MTVLAWTLLIFAWCIPGGPHRWTQRLLAERKAARYCPVCGDIGACMIVTDFAQRRSDERKQARTKSGNRNNDSKSPTSIHGIHRIRRHNPPFFNIRPSKLAGRMGKMGFGLLPNGRRTPAFYSLRALFRLGCTAPKKT